MYTPRYVFNQTYVWIFGHRKDAEHMVRQYTKWRHTDHYVVEVEGCGYLVRNVHNKLFDARGRVPDELFSVNAEKNLAFPNELVLTGS